MGLTHIFRLNRSGRPLAAAAIALIASHVCALAESVTIPGYAPEPGTEHVYHIRKSTLTDMTIWFDSPAASPQVMKGEFRQRMMVSTIAPGGMIQQWELSADLPPGVDGRFEMNHLYGTTLAAYGVNAVGVETDLNGNPTGLTDREAIIATIRKAAANGPGGTAVPPDSGLAGIIAMLEKNPLAAVEALVPEAMYLAVAQSHEAGTYETGQSWELQQEEEIDGVAAPVISTWRVEASDPVKQTATLSWKQVTDPQAMAKAQQAAINKLMDSFSDRVKTMSADQLARVRSTSKVREGSAVISLRNGASIEVNEVLTVVTGGVKIVSTVNLMREE